jgi:hypothetical protein
LVDDVDLAQAPFVWTKHPDYLEGCGEIGWLLLLCIFQRQKDLFKNNVLDVLSYTFIDLAFYKLINTNESPKPYVLTHMLQQARELKHLVNKTKPKPLVKIVVKTLH